MAAEKFQGELLKKVESFYENKASVAEFAKMYEQWDRYDQDVQGIIFRGPSMTAKALSEYFPEGRDEITILDVAAGTGLVAVELHNLGFGLMDALDPSMAMLDRAKPKNLYRNLMCTFMDENTLDIDEGTYDAITSCGAIGEGHLPACAIKEMLRLVKPGGVVVVMGNAAFWKNMPEYSRVITDLENEGKLQTIKEEIIDNYRVSETPDKSKGILIVIKKI